MLCLKLSRKDFKLDSRLNSESHPETQDLTLTNTPEAQDSTNTLTPETNQLKAHFRTRLRLTPQRLKTRLKARLQPLTFTPEI